MTKKLIPPLIFALLLLTLWQVIVSVFHIPEFLLPSPVRILEELGTDYFYLLQQGATTLIEALSGLFVAIAVGFLMGTTFALSAAVERMALPYAIASQAVPIVAVAPLLTLWLGAGI